MKHSLLIRIALLLVVGLGFGVLLPTTPAIAAPQHDVNDDINGGPVIGNPSEIPDEPVAQKSSVKKSAVKKKTTSKKSKAKKSSAKKSTVKYKQTFLKAPAAAKAQARPIYGTPDPNVDEPSEMITAIKNGAQDKFWDGKRPYPEQLRERGLVPPPSAPVFTGAIAQNELQKRGASGDVAVRSDLSSNTSPSNTLRRVSFSEISGVTFDDQPLRLSASEPFRRSLDTVSFELGRPCKNQEYFGWPMQQSEQSRVDRIFEETNEKMKLRGYNLQPRKARSVGSDVAAFTADKAGKKLLGIWSAGDVGLLLLMCDSDTSKEDAYAAKLKQQSDAAAAKKSKSKAKTKKKTKKSAVKNEPAKKERSLFKANTPASEPSTGVVTDSIAGGNSVIGSGGTEPDAPQQPLDPNTAPLGTTAPQAIAPPTVTEPQPVVTQPVAPSAETPTTETPLVPAPPEEGKPQVIPGAPPKDLPPEPTQSTPQSTAPAINPSTAFIPADAPTAAKDAAKEATKDAIKDVVKDVAPSVLP